MAQQTDWPIPNRVPGFVENFGNFLGLVGNASEDYQNRYQYRPWYAPWGDVMGLFPQAAGALWNYMTYADKQPTPPPTPGRAGQMLPQNLVPGARSSMATQSQVSNGSSQQEIELLASLIMRYFPQEEWENAFRVAMAESGGNPQAHNPVGEDSRGFFQINMRAHPNAGNTFDPEQNVAYAANLWQRQGWNPWTTAVRMGIANGPPRSTGGSPLMSLGNRFAQAVSQQDDGTDTFGFSPTDIPSNADLATGAPSSDTSGLSLLPPNLRDLLSRYLTGGLTNTTGAFPATAEGALGSQQYQWSSGPNGSRRLTDTDPNSQTYRWVWEYPPAVSPDSRDYAASLKGTVVYKPPASSTRQTFAQEIADYEAGLGRTLSPAERNRLAGLGAPQESASAMSNTALSWEKYRWEQAQAEADRLRQQGRDAAADRQQEIANAWRLKDYQIQQAQFQLQQAQEARQLAAQKVEWGVTPTLWGAVATRGGDVGNNPLNALDMYNQAQNEPAFPEDAYAAHVNAIGGYDTPDSRAAWENQYRQERGMPQPYGVPSSEQTPWVNALRTGSNLPGYRPTAPATAAGLTNTNFMKATGQMTPTELGMLGGLAGSKGMDINDWLQAANRIMPTGRAPRARFW